MEEETPNVPLSGKERHHSSEEEFEKIDPPAPTRAGEKKTSKSLLSGKESCHWSEEEDPLTRVGEKTSKNPLSGKDKQHSSEEEKRLTHRESSQRKPVSNIGGVISNSNYKTI